jgi:hypothetical protein
MGKSQDASAISSSSSSSSRGNDGVAVFRSSELYPLRFGFLSRRDLRTQPGVLTPGRNRKDTHPHQAHRNRARASDFAHVLVVERASLARPTSAVDNAELGLRRTSCARKWDWVGEVLAYCALSELRPCPRVGDAEGVADGLFCDDLAGKRNWGRRFRHPFRAGFDMTGLPGLKPLAQSCYPFGMKRPNLSRRPRDF